MTLTGLSWGMVCTRLPPAKIGKGQPELGMTAVLRE